MVKIAFNIASKVRSESRGRRGVRAANYGGTARSEFTLATCRLSSKTLFFIRTEKALTVEMNQMSGRICDPHFGFP